MASGAAILHTEYVDEPTKSKSPFFPGQPVPVEFFVGRADQVNRILQRGAGQVASGKPVSIFVEGEYGIGKSSLVTFTQRLAEKKYKLLPIYVTLGGCKSMDDVAARTVECTLIAGGHESTRGEKLRNWLAKYVGEQGLFGFKINLQALKTDAPDFSSPQGMLAFFEEAVKRLSDEGVAGIFLVFDEINGIVGDPGFSMFLKSFVDENGVRREPVPLLLALCGTDDKRREMIQRHKPVDRIFDVIHVDAMSDSEMDEFFTSAFKSVGISVEPAALVLFRVFSAGLPKIMQMLGDSAYWIDRDANIDREDVGQAAFATAEDVGRKFVDQQVFNALRSEKYQAILDIIGQQAPLEMSFVRGDIMASLSDVQQKVFDNFLQRMRQLNVIRQGERKGEYVFNVLMVRYYIYITAQRRKAQ
ncbi:MAG: hypothetical protein UZ18_ATM001001557 [Armatimonadetes bacterium OLB18]|nr:MAG: hypothetical protein UZ18_ATM001001557 [Armatimonadetes bacterium OLB18]